MTPSLAFNPDQNAAWSVAETHKTESGSICGLLRAKALFATNEPKAALSIARRVATGHNGEDGRS